jgi:PhnB protein
MNAYLSFNSQCEEAFRFYEKCLGGKITMMMKYGESPMAEQTPAGQRENVMHVTFQLGSDILNGADSPPEHYRTPQGFSVALDLSDPAEAERIYEAFSEKGTVQMTLQETFWAQRFAMVTDQFGIPWMINCGKPL